MMFHGRVRGPYGAQNTYLMPQTSKRLGGHIALSLSVRSSVRHSFCIDTRIIGGIVHYKRNSSYIGGTSELMTRFRSNTTDLSPQYLSLLTFLRWFICCSFPLYVSYCNCRCVLLFFVSHLFFFRCSGKCCLS